MRLQFSFDCPLIFLCQPLVFQAEPVLLKIVCVVFFTSTLSISLGILNYVKCISGFVDIVCNFSFIGLRWYTLPSTKPYELFIYEGSYLVCIYCIIETEPGEGDSESSDQCMESEKCQDLLSLLNEVLYYIDVYNGSDYCYYLIIAPLKFLLNSLL